MADDIEIHFDPRRGELSLACGGESFARVRDAVIAAADLGSMAIEGVTAEVRVIQIAAAPSPRPPARLRHRLALLGCGVVGLEVLLALAVGAGTIAGWGR